ncbi:MAG: SIS domain-containing protein [Patescibacteria group bacterium]
MTYTNLPNLNEVVLAALDFFAKNKPASLNLKSFSFPIVVGSGNAYNAGQIIFADQPAIIATESNFKKILTDYKKLINNKTITQAVVISASGEKDSVWEIKLAKKNKLKTTLLTCSPDSSAAKLADHVIAYKKLPEPYTYNTSTYLGIIMAAGKEEVGGTKDFIKKLKLPTNFKKYSAYSFILPDEFGAIAPMLEIKRNELFGPYLSLRAFSFGEARHAKFVNNFDKELVISFGENKYFGLKNNRFQIKIPNNAGNSFIMALAYYLIGLIQESKPAYFKKNIEKFCLEGPKAYGSNKPFSVIVK